MPNNKKEWKWGCGKRRYDNPYSISNPDINFQLYTKKSEILDDLHENKDFIPDEDSPIENNFIKPDSICRDKKSVSRPCDPDFETEFYLNESPVLDKLDGDSIIFNVISTILEETLPIESVFTISQSTEEFKPFQEQREELTLTEKIQVKWSPELFDICHKAKNLYNFALFVCRKVYFLFKGNPNVSWDDFLTIRENIMPNPTTKNYSQKRQKLLETFDKLKNIIKYKQYAKIGNTLSTLIKYSKFYESIGYAKTSQQINRVLGRSWQTYKSLLSLYFKGELEDPPKLPHFKQKEGEFMVVLPSQMFFKDSKTFKNHLETTRRITHYKKYTKTTAELLFPPRYRELLPKIRVRYGILKKLREVRIIPRNGYYDFEIRYNKPIKFFGLCRDHAVAIDLGVRNPFAIANNLGLQPILLQGNELKRVNYFINSKTPEIRSTQGIYRDILKKEEEEKSKNSKKSVLQILQEKFQKYVDKFQWKKKIANIILNDPTMTYDQFKILYGDSKNNKRLFTYIKKLPDANSVKDYLFYEKNEISRKQRICDYLKNDLIGKPENTHVQRVRDLNHQNQTILDKLFKIYRNQTRDAIHKMSRFVIDYCKQIDIGTIVIGYNEAWKQHSTLSKFINRKFIPIPFYKMIQAIKYKAMLCGITVIIQEESYTSKCSAMDKESIKFHSNYDGIRNPAIRGKDNKSHTHYGQFYSRKSDKYIHSDVNGAFNIGRKGKPQLFDNIPQNWMLIPPVRLAVT